MEREDAPEVVLIGWGKKTKDKKNRGAKKRNCSRSLRQTGELVPDDERKGANWKKNRAAADERGGKGRKYMNDGVTSGPLGKQN